ncbi:coiled-coil domain-containing protein-domain-containing protein [Thermothelomyces heterothallicus CBS 202.75]|uniref:coiled-coil domain-containing protein-domain-containing protein n=1 Tax=Thermothelomyces heterothallicus CBS 202.75 TaxID=1149848 RepID=UPI0037422DFA
MAPRFDSPPSTPDSFSQPRPRPPRSPGHSAQIRIQNRRRAYLERHESYFQSIEHELSDPLLYDFLIRRFQTPAEREAEGRAKGYARVLEGSLLRGEERLAKLREQTVGKNNRNNNDDNNDNNNNHDSSRDYGREEQDEEEMEEVEDGDGDVGDGGGDGGSGRSRFAADGGGGPGTTFSSLAAELVPPPRTREEGRAQWEEYLRDRFIRGEDDDFDYSLVDDNEEYDVFERVDREEAWFEDEEPQWATSDEEGEGGKEKILQGETGIQDF